MSVLAERCMEAVGPIVVKEVRQGLRARVFAICFALLLLACVVTALIAAAEVGEGDLTSLGPRYLTLFLCGLAIVCFFVIPYTAYRSMAREREDETWVLLALTGLSSRRIVRGKVVSAFTQALLYSSVGAPFILFSYFLNGVDLPTLLLEVAFAGCWAFALTSIAVALGTEGHTRIGRAVVHFLVLGVLGAATAGGMAFGANFAREGGEWIQQDGFLIFAAAFPVLLVSSAFLVLEGAAAGLSLASDANVKGARMVFCAQIVVTVVGTYLGASLDKDTPRDIPMVFSVMTSLFTLGFGFFAVSEQDGYPRALARPGMWGPGALRSFQLVMLTLMGLTAAWGCLYGLLPNSGYRDARSFYATFAGPLYVGLYLSVGVVLGRTWPLKDASQPLATRVAFLSAVAIAAILSPVAAVIAGERANHIGFNALNPVFGMVNFLERMHEAQGVKILILLFAAWAVWSSLAWIMLKNRDGPRLT